MSSCYARLVLGPLIVLAACGLIPERAAGLECQRTPANGRELREGEDPKAPGGPLADRDVTTMSAAEVGEAAEAAGFGVTYRYEYNVGPQPESGGTGYAECWCVAPPAGDVTDAAYDSIGRVIVFVDAGVAVDEVRPQPTLGWGCDAEPVPLTS